MRAPTEYERRESAYRRHTAARDAYRRAADAGYCLAGALVVAGAMAVDVWAAGDLVWLLPLVAVMAAVGLGRLTVLSPEGRWGRRVVAWLVARRAGRDRHA